MPTLIFVFDLDGTLSDPAHRHHLVEGQHPDWPRFHAAAADDPPHAGVLALARTLHASPAATVAVCTTRGEEQRTVTEAWLAAHGLRGVRVRMRAEGDRRNDAEVKREQLAAWTAADERPVLAVDDGPSAGAMWRAEGITVLDPGTWHESDATPLAQRDPPGEHPPAPPIRVRLQDLESGDEDAMLAAAAKAAGYEVLSPDPHGDTLERALVTRGPLRPGWVFDPATGRAGRTGQGRAGKNATYRPITCTEPDDEALLRAPEAVRRLAALAARYGQPLRPRFVVDVLPDDGTPVRTRVYGGTDLEAVLANECARLRATATLGLVRVREAYGRAHGHRHSTEPTGRER